MQGTDNGQEMPETKAPVAAIGGRRSRAGQRKGGIPTHRASSSTYRVARV